MDNTKLTSVKIIKNLYDNFKVKTVNTDMTLQKLTNRALDMYLKNENFEKDLEIYDELLISGSIFLFKEIIGYVKKEVTLTFR